MKKAILVQTCFTSRIIVECNEEGNVISQTDAIKKVTNSILDKIKNDEVGENIETWFDDYEVPYDPETDKEC